MAKKPKQKKSILFWIILVVVVAGGLWYYYKAPAQAAPATPQPVVEKAGVEKGDMVAIDFVLAMSNGTVIDTNNEALANANNISTFSKGPFRFIVGQSGKVKGFDEAILGLELENFTKVIEPTEPVIKIVVNRTRHISRNMPLPRFQTFTETAFEKYFKKKPVINEVVSNPFFPWPYKVVNVSENNNIVCDPVVVEGKSYKLPSLEWNSSLLAVSNNDIVFRHNPVDGQIIHTELGDATVRLGVGVINVTYAARIGEVVKKAVSLPDGGELVIPQSFRIAEANDNQFVLTRINYLPQETLVLTGQLLEWTKDVKEVKEPLKAKASVKAVAN
jgi:hypothetical protein